MRPFIALLLCLMPALSQAQSAQPADVNQLLHCVENYARGAPQSRVTGGCVGIIGAQCGDQTTIGIADCISRETAAWDQLLNAWWAPMRERAKAKGNWDQLLSGQRQWIKDRDAACQAAYDAAGGGSIRVIWGAECQRDWTAQKAVEFYYTLYK